MDRFLTRLLIVVLLLGAGEAFGQSTNSTSDSAGLIKAKDSLLSVMKADTLRAKAQQGLKVVAQSAKNRIDSIGNSLITRVGVMKQSIKPKAGQFNAPGEAKQAFLRMADSLHKIERLRQALGLSSATENLINSFSNLNSKNKNLLSKRSKALKESVKSSVKGVGGAGLGMKLTFEDAIRYQPYPTTVFAGNQVKWANVISVNGALNAFGVPLNLNFSTDKGSSYTNSRPGNQLFKFDFDPKTLGETFKSDLQQYASIKNQFLGGQDINGYVKEQLTGRLNNELSAAKLLSSNKALSSYLQNPSNIQQLLVMTKKEMIAELSKQSLKSLPSSKMSVSQRISSLSKNELMMKDKLDLQKSVAGELMGEGSVASYFNDPANIEQIRYMGKDQIKAKMQQLQLSAIGGKSATVPETPLLVADVDIHTLLRKIMAEHDYVKDSAMDALSQHIFISARQSGRVNTGKYLENIRQQTDSKLQLLEMDGISPASGMVDGVASSELMARMSADIEAEKVAVTILNIRQDLKQKGLDVDKMVVMQNYLNQGDYRSGISEMGAALVNKKSVNATQQLLTHLSALKVGAFSNHVPGATSDQDLFIKGGNITLKPGRTPVTFGYGSVSDMSAAKDAGFEGSAFNQPRNVSYINADFRNSGRGALKISVIGSVNRQVNTSLYTIPTVSSNNVALTVSKAFDIGKFGALDIDASKSSTLYANKYQPGALGLIDRRAGLTTDYNNDLFNSLAFGARHHLDLPIIGTSDNVYFSYSGVGYQNPANNGFGGAKTKFGGNIRKALYHNKLVLNLRSDFTNMPISYTSDDRWKTTQFQMDGRYQVSKQFNFNLRYATNGTNKRIAGVSNQVYAFQKFQFDGNANYKIGKRYSVSHFSVGTQGISNPTVTGQSSASSQLLLVNYVQSMVLRKNVLTFNLFYNKELTSTQLIGNTLNTDLSYQFTLFKRFSLSSGMTFLENSGIARQAGIKQSIQLFSAGQFDFGTFIDVRKNLVKPLYADLYPSCRAEVNLKYHISTL